MSAPLFTPGPWQAISSQPVDGWDGFTIAAQPHPAMRGFTKVIAEVAGERFESKDIGEANARLIAAAPDLFHALNGLIGLVQLARQRDDCPLEIKQALAGNYRLDDAFEALSKANPAVGHSNLQGDS